MTEKVHPTLEAVARAIAGSNGASAWDTWLPEARAALNALRGGGTLAKAVAHSLDFTRGSVLSEAVLIAVTEVLDEIAAEPKPTVEDLLREHVPVTWEVDGEPGGPLVHCRCGVRERGGLATHQANKLREAGLLTEGDA